MYDYMVCDGIIVELRNRSFKAVCPNCGNINVFVADGEITLRDISNNVIDRFGKGILSIDDMDISLKINMLCKKCRDKNSNKDNCFIQDYAFNRLLSAFSKFTTPGIKEYNFCKLCKISKATDGSIVNSYIMPSVSYIIRKSEKDITDSILFTVMNDKSITEDIYVVLNCNTYEDDTKYYGIEFYNIEFSLDQAFAAIIYDPEKDGDYKVFCDNLFIRKIDQLARLIELAAP